jgi:hypothetical protein
VNRFLDGYRQAAAIHSWLRARRARGQALPRTLEEYAHAMVADRVGQDRATQKKQASKAKSQMGALRRL